VMASTCDFHEKAASKLMPSNFTELTRSRVRSQLTRITTLAVVMLLRAVFDKRNLFKRTLSRFNAHLSTEDCVERGVTHWLLEHQLGIDGIITVNIVRDGHRATERANNQTVKEDVF